MGRVRDKKNKAAAETVGQKFARRRALHEIRAEAAEFAEGIAINADPAQAIQQILDTMVQRWQYAQQQVWTLTEDEYFTDTIAGKRPHHWIVEEERLALQIVHTAAKAASIGLAERQIQLQEQQAAIFATVVEAALKAAGVDSEKRREIHQGISTSLDDIVGTARDLPRATAA
jgi:hypothetical protein